MRVMRMPPESKLCAGTKNFLFSSSAKIDQRFLRFINKVLINYKDRWYNSGGMHMRTTLIVYGI
jgi:hypothetical protein